MIEDLLKEYERAKSLYPDYHSFHEGYGVLLEEVDELFDEIKEKNQNINFIYLEAVQVAAVAIRIAELAKSRMK